MEQIRSMFGISSSIFAVESPFSSVDSSVELEDGDLEARQRSTVLKTAGARAICSRSHCLASSDGTSGGGNKSSIHT